MLCPACSVILYERVALNRFLVWGKKMQGKKCSYATLFAVFCGFLRIYIRPRVCYTLIHAMMMGQQDFVHSAKFGKLR
jgi:hypothetical protein